jgi:Protein of unknown function (DUF1077)
VSNRKANSGKAAQALTARSDPSTLQLAKAWEVSYSPAKNLPMNGIMLYMSGNSVQIFSMMAVGMLFTGPIKGIASTEQCEHAALLQARGEAGATLTTSFSYQLSHDINRRSTRYYCRNWHSSRATSRRLLLGSGSAGVWAYYRRKAATGSPGDNRE